MENEDNLYDVVFDINFIAKAVTAQMQIEGVISDTDRMEIEYIELEDDKINVIARKIEGTVN